MAGARPSGLAAAAPAGGGRPAPRPGWTAARAAGEQGRALGAAQRRAHGLAAAHPGRRRRRRVPRRRGLAGGAAALARGQGGLPAPGRAATARGAAQGGPTAARAAAQSARGGATVSRRRWRAIQPGKGVGKLEKVTGMLTVLMDWMEEGRKMDIDEGGGARWSFNGGRVRRVRFQQGLGTAELRNGWRRQRARRRRLWREGSRRGGELWPAR